MSSPIASPPPTILAVDDEPRVLATLKLLLEREGFNVVTAGSPARGLELIQDRDFAVILADQLMPGMTGLEFVVECQRIQPHASRILITAAASLSVLVDAINRGEIYRFLAKPWLREELIATVRNAVSRHELIVQNLRLHEQTLRLNRELSATNNQLAGRLGELQLQQRALDETNAALERRYAHSLELCSRILATFDPFLAGRTKSMYAIVDQMCGSPHFNDEERHALRTSTWMCDLGLIGVSREILQAYRADPASLSSRDLDSIQQHPIYSQTLAAHVDERPLVGETVRAHHERFDGRGYPDGIAGQTIPWTARCLAVAVCFVECGLPREGAVALLTNESGHSLDPEALRLFLQTTHLSPLPRTVREIMLEDLKPGMVLAHGLYSPHGLLLVAEGQTLSQPTIAKILNHNLVTPISQRLLVRN